MIVAWKICTIELCKENHSVGVVNENEVVKIKFLVDTAVKGDGNNLNSFRLKDPDLHS